jgi:hypothetical protein
MEIPGKRAIYETSRLYSPCRPCLPAAGYAQIVSGAIVGTAPDAAAAAVANAKVMATNESTGVARSTVTDSAGGYVLPQLTAHPTFSSGISAPSVQSRGI